MRFDIPRGQILEVRQADILFDPTPHPYEVEHAAAIEANWQDEALRNPALFDGRVMFFSQIAWGEGRLDGRCHAIRYATLLHWRKDRDTASAEHLFAQAMPVAADGALVAIRMGPHTANAGRVYFAAGSLDLGDVRSGRLDLDGNMMREVMEETGIDISGCRRDGSFHGHSSDGGTVIVRRYYLPEASETIAGRIRDFIAAEAHPEISEPLVIRGPDDLPDGLMPHMLPLIAWHFAAAAKRSGKAAGVRP